MNGVCEKTHSTRYWKAAAGAFLLVMVSVATAPAQEAAAPGRSIEQQIAGISQAIDRIEAQMQQSQRDLTDLRRELSELRSGLDREPSAVPSQPAATLAAAVSSLREDAAMRESQIATLQESKLESASKYPVKLTGMVLMTGVVSTRRVDVADTPSIALSGPGATAATLRQTILGLDAQGSHLFGASSFADVNFDFGGSTSSGYTAGLLRLRTAHAELDWSRTRGFFALDHTLLNPGSPDSLVAVAQPALAWSGNLWTWNPQLGISQDLLSSARGVLRLQGALIAIADPPSAITAQYGAYAPPATSALSRWPGIQGRLALEKDVLEGAHFGVSGLFAPHRTAQYARSFDSWAFAADLAVPASRFMRLSGNVYTGSALGGLGGGAYKDYASTVVGGELYLKPLDDIGGWVQWQQKPGERLQFNEAFGLDEVPAHQLRPYAMMSPMGYYSLARNRTFSANAIYSPSASILFSLEYRRIASSYVTSPTQFADIIGIAAGYKF